MNKTKIYLFILDENLKLRERVQNKKKEIEANKTFDNIQFCDRDNNQSQK